MNINTGKQGFNTLSEKIINSEIFTGRTKPNVPEDPDYVEPTLNEESCEVISSSATINWSNQQSYTPFTDSDLVIFLNGSVQINEINDTSGSFVAKPSDILVIQQKAQIEWPANSSARLIVKRNSVTIYDHTTTTHNVIVNTFTMTVDYSDNIEIEATTSSQFGNIELSQEFTKNDCELGLIPTTYIYTVDANTYFANSQSEANNLALEDINDNGQIQANLNATCLVPDLEFHSKNSVSNFRQITSSSTGDLNQLLDIASLDTNNIIKSTLSGYLITTLFTPGNGKILIAPSTDVYRLIIKTNGHIRLGTEYSFDARIVFALNINGVKTTLETCIFNTDSIGGYVEEVSNFNINHDMNYTLNSGEFISTTIESYIITSDNSKLVNVLVYCDNVEIQIFKNS